MDGHGGTRAHPSARWEEEGRLADGRAVAVVTLAAGGVTVRLGALGATLREFHLPDRAGRVADVLVGYPSLAAQLARPNYWGETIGRYANRIAGGRFTLDGTTYQVPPNDGPHGLHGGADGFDKRLWTVDGVGADADGAHAAFTLHSPAGDGGFPGALAVRAAYRLAADGTLGVDWHATTDAPTVVSLTTHAAWHLGGPDAPAGVDGHELTVPAARFTPVDATLVPTGELRAVAGTPFDFTRARALGPAIRAGHDPQVAIARGIDHNYALDKGATTEPGLVARLHDPASGRMVEFHSTAPGVQVYTGNWLDGTIAGKGGRLYRMGDAVAIEPQLFPDTPNRPAFGSARLDPGQEYHHRLLIRPSVAG